MNKKNLFYPIIMLFILMIGCKKQNPEVLPDIPQFTEDDLYIQSARLVHINYPDSLNFDMAVDSIESKVVGGLPSSQYVDKEKRYYYNILLKVSEKTKVYSEGGNYYGQGDAEIFQVFYESDTVKLRLIHNDDESIEKEAIIILKEGLNNEGDLLSFDFVTSENGEIARKQLIKSDSLSTYFVNNSINYRELIPVIETSKNAKILINDQLYTSGNVVDFYDVKNVKIVSEDGTDSTEVNIQILPYLEDISLSVDTVTLSDLDSLVVTFTSTYPKSKTIAYKLYNESDEEITSTRYFYLNDENDTSIIKQRELSLVSSDLRNDGRYILKFGEGENGEIPLETDLFSIYNEKDFLNMGGNLKGNYTLKNDLDFSSITPSRVLLDSSSFDGQNHTIHNWKGNMFDVKSNSHVDYIKNLKIEGGSDLILVEDFIGNEESYIENIEISNVENSGKLIQSVWGIGRVSNISVFNTNSIQLLGHQGDNTVYGKIENIYVENTDVKKQLTLGYGLNGVSINNVNIKNVLIHNPLLGYSVDNITVSNISLEDISGGTIIYGLLAHQLDNSVLDNVMIKNLERTAQIGNGYDLPIIFGSINSSEISNYEINGLEIKGELSRYYTIYLLGRDVSSSTLDKVRVLDLHVDNQNILYFSGFKDINNSFIKRCGIEGELIEGSFQNIELARIFKESTLENSYLNLSLIKEGGHSYRGSLIYRIEGNVTLKNNYNHISYDGVNTPGSIVSSIISNLSEGSVLNAQGNFATYGDFTVDKNPIDPEGCALISEELLKEGTSTSVLYGWDPEIWDFGTTEDFPILK